MGRKFLAATDAGFLELAGTEGCLGSHRGMRKRKQRRGSHSHLTGSWAALGRDKEDKHFDWLSADSLVPEALEWEGSTALQTGNSMTLRNTAGKWNPGCWEGCDNAGAPLQQGSLTSGIYA